MTRVLETGPGTRDDPHAQARDARNQPLLLHSMALFRELFAELFDRRSIRTVVEIGVETGQVSACYAELGAEAVHCVEPVPSDEMRAAMAGNDALHLVEGRSPQVLSQLPVADLYVIDGDHNYATVRAELDWILTHAPDALIALHDVLWPCSRRDQYYEPHVLPAAQTHPRTADGPTVWHDEVTPAGFVGLGQFTAAEHAGGEGNGVLTAVEDALAEHGGRRLEIVPAVFGLGVILREDADQDLSDALRPFTSSALLKAMENNRIALYTRVLALQHEAVAHADEADRQVRLLAERHSEAERLRRRCDELRVRHEEELAALRNRHAELQRRFDSERPPKLVRELLRVARGLRRRFRR
ncbi:class I SAM-dependent methyltransferase [Saccharopolyspora sp. TS4A08]|uniref:Class I SAM-dependent methyltransferase n=1 Tax=Saccharopolyspora ipomoeae TaxID=3042027 RepID=A0ABT6PXJ1_9PSEU|nr:class I SAM-dependent methyltransferase [Saccharopolyspora sp. TS4A08]MDI2032717.1 class I SAM-dependent methyltransferase [Saccharopolyspora sp. TS4A08]